MVFALDVEAAGAVFTLPQNDGSFSEEQTAYLRTLGRRRPSVLFAFPPKSGGTFLRMAAIYAVDGQLTRIVHAQGGRDATPYLPVYLLYLSGGYPDSTLVTHVHMQAFPANRHFIQALDLKPVIMLRSVPDMVVSYLDMLVQEELSANHWLNAAIPEAFRTMDDFAKAEFLIDTVVPWYASYYATWAAFAVDDPGRVCVLRFSDLQDRPAAMLKAVLDHSGLPRPDEVCELAIDSAWHARHEHRFNRGEDGRGQRLPRDLLLRIGRRLDYYRLDAWREELMPAG
jgi:Sulfotransferase domain